MHDNVTSPCNILHSYSKTTHLKIDKQTFHITKNGNDYVFAHLNCVSVLKHFEEIRDIVSIHAIDVLSLNETRLSSCIDNNQILIEGFNVYCNDRNRLGGGVLLYVKTILSSNIVLFLMNDEVESVWVELPMLYKDRNGLIVGSIYSSSSYMSRVHSHLECATATDKRLVLLGNFNIDQQTQSDKIEKFESEFGITQLIHAPTRVN